MNKSTAWFQGGALLVFLSIATVPTVRAWAADVLPGALPEATGRVVLTIEGRIAGDAPVDLDFAALETLPAHVLRTTTNWTDGDQVFEGVLLRDLLAAVGAEGDTLLLTALNDYRIKMPAADASDIDVILAYRQNGGRMSVREKGPLWIIYPDTDPIPEAQTRMVWQLRRIEVQE